MMMYGRPHKTHFTLGHHWELQRQQTGSGLFDTFKRWGKKLQSAITGKTGTAVLNQLASQLDKGPTARPAYPGEAHALLKLKSGRWGRANYMGPGTNVVARIRRGDPPRTASDRVAQAHDIEYSLNPSNTTQADRNMIARMKDLESRKADAPFNISLGKRAIQAKLLAERAGIKIPLPTGSSGPMTDGDKVILRAKLQELEGKFAPGERIRQQLGKGRKKRKRKQSGKGVFLPGFSGGGITDLLVKGIRSMLKSLNVSHRHIPVAIDQLVSRALSKYKTIAKSAGPIAKILAPYLIRAKMKKVPGIKRLISQSGSGSKVPQHQKEVASMIKDGLLKLGKQSGAGCAPCKKKRQTGGSFWSGLKTFFTAVIMPLATVAVEVGTFGAATPFVLPLAGAAAAALVAT